MPKGPEFDNRFLEEMQREKESLLEMEREYNLQSISMVEQDENFNSSNMTSVRKKPRKEGDKKPRKLKQKAFETLS
jgi:hypothetical protein